MKDLIELVKKHYLKNRTIVSRDARPILEDIAKACGQKLILHRFPSRRDYGTWLIPDRWDVREAWLKGPDGKTIASYKDHPLFLAPYSIPFNGELTLAELKKHVRSHPTQKDAYFYEHRLAYDYRRRLKEWIITLPQNVVNKLPEGNYRVKIDVDIAPGEMLVGEIALKGSGLRQIALLADYCHPGQVNDSFSGILAMIEVVRRLKALKKRRYNYSLYLFPETIGSCALLAKNPKLIKKIDAAIFSEFVGWGDRWFISASDKSGSLAARLAAEAKSKWPEIELLKLYERSGGNDEYVFDYAGIGSMSVNKFECPEYHSSNDEPGRLKAEDLRRASEMIFRMCQVAEEDAVYAPKHPVPIYLTRYDLYKDAVEQRTEFKKIRSILYGIDGKNSLLDIAVKNGIEFETVKTFADRLLKLKLIRARPPRKPSAR